MLLDYCAGRLDPAAQVLLEDHLENCRDCQDFCDAQTALWKTLDHCPAPQPDPAFDARLLAGLPRRQPWLAWVRGISWKPAIPAVAVLALYFVVIAPRAPVPPQTGPDTQQVEQALADLDMLQQLKLDAR